ncbi:Signal peptidase complex subunit 1, partial [Stegodyphus mimosarum]
MSGIIEKIKNVPVHMDFDGQRKAERIFQTIILVFAAVGLVIGYIFQQFSYTVYILGAGFILSCILTLP